MPSAAARSRTSQVRAHRLGRERGGHRRHGLGDVAHVDEDEHADHLGADDARASVKRSTAAPLETASSTSSTRRPATSAPRTGGSSTSWPRSRLADEGERQPAGQRHRRGQRDAGGLGADDDVDAEVAGEPRAAGAEVPQQRGVGVRDLERERMDGRPAVVPVARRRTGPVRGAVASRVASDRAGTGWRWVTRLICSVAFMSGPFRFSLVGAPVTLTSLPGVVAPGGHPGR